MFGSSGGMQLNRDVFAYLVSFVSSTQDLLALCLTSKEYLVLAFPELEYRCIHCKLDNNALWIQLASNPGQASRIRSLEIGHNNFLVPKLLNARVEATLEDGDSDSQPHRMDDTKAAIQSEYLLVQAIKKMRNLESFYWDWKTPLVHQGAEVGGTVYEEDMWTNLRDYTSLKSLQVLDIPDFDAGDNLRPILNSTIFTLKDLTLLDLTFYHNPDGYSNGGNLTQGAGNTLRNGRVKIDGIKAITKQCPCLESLSLAIIDRQFYFEFEGNPYTDITTILQDAYWSELTVLKLHDIMIDGAVMTKFLLRHRKLETLSVILSIANLPLGCLPFHISSEVDLGQGFLPNLKTVTLDAGVMGQVLRALKEPCFLQSINSMEPRDWGAEDFDPPPSRIHTIHEPARHVIEIPMIIQDSAVPTPPGAKVEHILPRMPDLRSLVIKNIKCTSHLDDLPDLTPNLEELVCHRMIPFFDRVDFSYKNILPILTRWQKLKRFTGVSIWPCENFAGVDSEWVLTVARKIKAALPLIEEMTWWDGHLVRFKVDGDGELFLEKEKNEPGEY